MQCITCPHTRTQNGIVEQKHRHIVSTGLALLADASVPLKFWSYAFILAVYLINILPSPSMDKSSSFLLLHQKDPDYKSLKSFGCECWPLTTSYNKHKFDYRAVSSVFLGLSPHHKGYVCYHIPTGRTYMSKDVKFNELFYPFAHLSLPKPIMEPTHTALPLFNIPSQPPSSQSSSSILGPHPSVTHESSTSQSSSLDLQQPDLQ